MSWSGLVRKGIFSLSNLQIWHKLALMAIFFLIILLVVSFYLVETIKHQGVDVKAKEMEGVRYVSQLFILLGHTQMRLGLDFAYLSGDKSFAGRLERSNTQLEKDLEDIGALDRELGHKLKTTEQWEHLEKEFINHITGVDHTTLI